MEGISEGLGSFETTTEPVDRASHSSNESSQPMREQGLRCRQNRGAGQ